MFGMRVGIQDMEMSTFSVSGAGGQHRDHSNSGVRLIHLPSGASAEGRDSRKQSKNKKDAFIKLVNTKIFKDWYNKQIGFADLTVEQVSDTIRTYNMVDNRVTDHRTKNKSSQIDAILDGDIDKLYE